MGASTPSADLTAGGLLYEVMKILADPGYVLDHPVEERFRDDPWPRVRVAIAKNAIEARMYRKIQEGA